MIETVINNKACFFLGIDAKGTRTVEFHTYLWASLGIRECAINLIISKFSPIRNKSLFGLVQILQMAQKLVVVEDEVVKLGASDR